VVEKCWVLLESGTVVLSVVLPDSGEFQCKCEDVSTKADKTELFQDEEKFCFLCQNVGYDRQCVCIIWHAVE
jgi:hypothetical protein